MVAKQFGYESVEAYYRDACFDDKVTDIKVPTLFLNTEDGMLRELSRSRRSTQTRP